MINSPFSKRKPKDFRILMLYPNLHMSALMPQSIGIFTSLLKREGFKLDLFDCTYYEDIDTLTLGKNTNEENAALVGRRALHFPSSHSKLLQMGVEKSGYLMHGLILEPSERPEIKLFETVIQAL